MWWVVISRLGFNSGTVLSVSSRSQGTQVKTWLFCIGQIWWRRSHFTLLIGFSSQLLVAVDFFWWVDLNGLLAVSHGQNACEGRVWDGRDFSMVFDVKCVVGGHVEVRVQQFDRLVRRAGHNARVRSVHTYNLAAVKSLDRTHLKIKWWMLFNPEVSLEKKKSMSAT